MVCFGLMHAAVDGSLGTSAPALIESSNQDDQSESSRAALNRTTSASVHVSALLMFAGAWSTTSLHIPMRPFAVTLPMTRRPLAPLR